MLFPMPSLASFRPSPTFLAAVVAATLAAATTGAGAQSAPPAEPGAPVPSRWAADLDRLDEEARLALLTPNDPRANFVRAVLDHADIASQVAHLAAARNQAPQEPLYVAALAAACVQPTQPVLPDCERVDRLADWARRDEDNGVPEIVLSDRARRRGETDQMIAHLNEAAGKARFEEYWGRGMLVAWDYFRASPLAYDAAAKAVAAVTYAGEQPLIWPTALQGVCVNPRQPSTDALRAACARLGQALADRSRTWSGRLIGIALLARSTPDAGGRRQVDERRVALDRTRARCDDRRRARFDGLEAGDPPTRAQALAAADAWIRAQAQYGEVGACEQLAGRGR